MSKFPLYLAFAATCALSGCGDVAERSCTHQLTIHGAHPHQSLTVSIRPVPVVPSDPEQRLVTDSHGDGSVRFASSWSAAYLVFPPVGAVPRRPPKPEYLVVSGNHQLVVTPKTPDAQYHWQDGGWFTDASLHP